MFSLGKKQKSWAGSTKHDHIFLEIALDIPRLVLY